jgi:hypothetical protein
MENHMPAHVPHHANVAGDFYVEDGCCTMCEVPFTEATGLFGHHADPEGYQHCFVKRQPQDLIELEQMVSAIRCAELGCIRYRGDDRLIISRLREADSLDVCDNSLTE